MSRVKQIPESVMQAYHRMGRDIEEWTRDHAEDMQPEERDRIASLLDQFKESYGKLEQFIEEAYEFFGDEATSLTPRSSSEETRRQGAQSASRSFRATINSMLSESCWYTPDSTARESAT